MSIPINRDTDGETIQICTLEAKRAFAIALLRLGEFIVSIPSDEFGAVFQMIFSDPVLLEKARAFLLEINNVALKAKEGGKEV